MVFQFAEVTAQSLPISAPLSPLTFEAAQRHRFRVATALQRQCRRIPWSRNPSPICRLRHQLSNLSAMTTASTTSSNTEVLGNSKDFWFWSADQGWDLTHPAQRDAEPFKGGLLLEAKTSNITIDPAKTALLIIDMQNVFLSSALGRQPVPETLLAERTIAEFAIPAARKAGIQIVWLTGG